MSDDRYRYELLELAGEGGMAEVWRGVRTHSNGEQQSVAIKKMKPEFRAMKNYIDMFVEEARVGADLKHANIVEVYDFRRDADGGYYLVMEWVDGVDLHSLIYGYKAEGHELPWQLAVSIAVGMLKGLEAAHRRCIKGKPAPVVHRDISPANVLLSESGDIKLTDFGLARAKDRIAKLTAPGMVKGKLSYLAPEQAKGGEATKASDIYAVANTLWESLAQRRLFAGKSDLEVYQQIRAGTTQPIDALRADVPDALTHIVATALATNPDDRFQTAAAMATALTTVLAVAPPDDEREFVASSVRWIRSQRDRSSTPMRSAHRSLDQSWSLIIDFSDVESP